MSVFIYSGGDLLQITRRFVKIQDFLAQLGGPTSGVSMILGFLIVPYARVVMMQAVGRELFKIKILKEGDPEKPQKPNNTKKSSKITPRDHIKNSEPS